MEGDQEDRDYFFNRKPGKAIYSKSLPTGFGTNIRIVSEIVDGDAGLKFAIVKDELVLRTTPSGRYKVKATFVEDNRQIRSLVFQRYHTEKGPLERDTFTVVGKEVDNLLNFLVGIRTVELESAGKKHVTNEQLRDLILNEAEARQLFADHEELFIRVAESEELQRDLVAVGYRRKQLERFEHLLNESAFFEGERQRLNLKPEALWQAFFEANTWIFGYGLSYQFVAALHDRKLEQVVRGFDVTGRGKRVDALMKTQARINSLCFVEIKRHDTSLLASAYRPGAWPPSIELSGGVAQLQATVQDAIERIGRKLDLKDSNGNPTSETLFNVEPRSFLLIGNLDEFATPNGINEDKFRSFETYRRNIHRPEIITFDELLYRARFIVDHGNGDERPVQAPEPVFDDDVPF